MLELAALGAARRWPGMIDDRLDPSGAVHRLRRVEQEVGDDPVEQVLVGLDLDRRRPAPRCRRPGPVSGCSRTSWAAPRTTAVRSTVTKWLARTREKSRNSPSSRLSRSLSRTISWASTRSSGSSWRAARQLLDRAADRGERVPDLVRQRRRERGDRLEPLGPDVKRLQLLEVGDVGENRGDARQRFGRRSNVVVESPIGTSRPSARRAMPSARLTRRPLRDAR